jgi:succinylglutamate desuccinylase
VLGSYDTGGEGPILAVIAGLHGNEPAGILAAQRVLAGLRDGALPFRGRLVALAGNLGALAVGQRFIARDLNRLWTAHQIAQLEEAAPESDDPERAEQRALLGVLRALAREARSRGRELIVLDLHSTSAPSAPFAVINDTLRNRGLALAVPVPLILGLEEAVRGALLDYTADAGHEFVMLEGGQHAAPDTPDLLAAGIWHVLVGLGAITAAAVPGFDQHRARLREAADGAPRVAEVLYRHEIQPHDGFRMNPGLASFHTVHAGDIVAHDRTGPVRAPLSGFLLLPLDQERGEDGFFIARPVGRKWLTVSAVVRGLRLDRLLPWLPGARRDPQHHDVVRVDRRIARWGVVQVFHLAGYRRLPARDGRLAFRSRRRR